MYFGICDLNQSENNTTCEVMVIDNITRNDANNKKIVQWLIMIEWNFIPQ